MSHQEVTTTEEQKAGDKVTIETVSAWDGEEKINALEASNGVTKCRGVIFCPERRCYVNSFSYYLRLCRGRGVAFKPIIAEWDQETQRASEILYRGETQVAESQEFIEYKAEIPNDVQVEAGPDRHLVLGFYTEENTEMRSASVELGQIPSVVVNPPIPKSLYLNGKFASGTWRAYECTLAMRLKFTLL
uniref:Uncharacterized protein n=1 Tax=Hanusia phi TaxID=3032 RepID=A0A7S0HS04_9CRYP